MLLARAFINGGNAQLAHYGSVALLSLLFPGARGRWPSHLLFSSSVVRQPSALMAGAMTSNLAGGEAGRVDRCALRTGF